jgi:hypothetical protein
MVLTLHRNNSNVCNNWGWECLKVLNFLREPCGKELYVQYVINIENHKSLGGPKEELLYGTQFYALSMNDAFN